VPKGGIDEGETPLAGAIRELAEETGLVYEAETLTCKFTGAEHKVTAVRNLGRHEYTKRKDLELFELTVSSDIDVRQLKCESMVQRPNYSFPELDRFVLADSNLHKFVTSAMYAWLKANL
jgi:8-oxo-dGTP pyrophosphatase MutT (NUDIX family)